MSKAHVKRGDEVVVIAGTERGKRGKVIRVLGEKNRFIVEGVKMIKRHTRKHQQHPQGAIVERETHQALLAKRGLYASMWNRQREAEAAREKLAEIGDDVLAPNRNPPPVEEEPVAEDAAVPRAHAAE